ncbi:MAG: hypothetical protein Q8R15_04070, partial [Candidatus Micrarchaeota archaeon]|nr:hypothetical protein [Candidatus Micrarchaeota archaeon]
QKPKESFKEVLTKAFYELGKMHGAGIQHGHPHYRNLLVDEDRNLMWVDPKFLRRSNQMPLAQAPYDLSDVRIPSTDVMEPGAINDLLWFVGDISIKQPTQYDRLNWEEVNKHYRKGFEEGKRRVEKLKLDG